MARGRKAGGRNPLARELREALDREAEGTATAGDMGRIIRAARAFLARLDRDSEANRRAYASGIKARRAAKRAEAPGAAL